jgi:hypothetical protein
MGKSHSSVACWRMLTYAGVCRQEPLSRCGGGRWHLHVGPRMGRPGHRNVYMYICMCVCVCVYMYIYIYIYICCICIYIYIYIYMYVCYISVYIHENIVCVCVRVYVYIYICIYTNKLQTNCILLYVSAYLCILYTYCMRPSATSVWGIKPLLYVSFSRRGWMKGVSRSRPLTL